MPAALGPRAPLPALLWLAGGAAAVWVPIGEVPPAAYSPAAPTARAWAPLEGHRLHPDLGYDARCLGNLAGAQRLEPLRAARNHALVAPVAAGTPEQRFRCLLDAGSADLWLPSRRCASCAVDAKERRGFFKVGESSTFKTWTVTTQFGPSLHMLRLVYGGGSAKGLVANDTIKLASATVPQQTFVLAEVGSEDAKDDRSWDGVCGLGRSSAHEGTPFHDRLSEAVYVLSPAPERSHGSEALRLAVGQVPAELVRRSSIAWVPATPAAELGDGRWAADARISIQDSVVGFRPRRAIAVFETGTSYFLVPSHLYLPFARALLFEGAFDELCGVDAHAGNVVVCSCEARQKVASGIDVEFKDVSGAPRRFTLHPEDLFEEVFFTSRSTSGGAASVGAGLCVLQVQQRPSSGLGEDARRLASLDHAKTVVADGAAGGGLGREDEVQAEGDSDVWVLGDVFLRRYALVLDFRHSRIGLGLPGTSAKGAATAQKAEAAGAAVEALVSGQPTGTIQTYDQGALGGSLAVERLRTTAAHLLGDSLADQAGHVRGAAAHLLSDPVVPAGVFHLRSAASDMMVPPPEEPEPAEDARRSVRGPQPSALASLVIGSAALGAMALGGFVLRWQLLRLESTSPVLARLVGVEPEDLDEETAGLTVVE